VAQGSPLQSGMQGPQPRSVMATSPQTFAERAIELSKRALEARSLDELLFLLTNDTRTLIDFERAWVISHLGGPSRLAATNNQPGVNGKSAFVNQVNDLAKGLKGYDKSVFLSRRILEQDALGNKMPPALKEALKSFIRSSGMSHVLVLPLVHQEATVGHLAFEFAEGHVSSEDAILGLLNVTPFLAAALAERSLLEQKPDLIEYLVPHATGKTALVGHARRYVPIALVAAFVLAVVLFVVPFPFTVGGEAEIASKTNHMAFCCLDGVIDEVCVREGERVHKGQLLARLDPKELEYQILSWKSQYEILSQEMNRLSMESGEHPAKLVERKMAELKRSGAWNELQYLNWKKQFLEIRAPVSGIILTRDVQTLAGKRLNHGETLCEIAKPDELEAHVFVPEDRVSRVAVGQEARVYLNGEPSKGYRVRLEEVSPCAEVRQRQGTLYRVKAPFLNGPDSLRVGMKGTGKIYTGNSSLWHVVTDRLHTRWNQLLLHF
jgi:multidrug resistance efflux pump